MRTSSVNVSNCGTTCGSTCGSTCGTTCGSTCGGTTICRGCGCGECCPLSYKDTCTAPDSSQYATGCTGTGAGTMCAYSPCATGTLNCDFDNNNACECPGAPGGHGSAMCNSLACSTNFACDSGYHSCGGDCYLDDDVNHCGAGCSVCTAPTGGTVACTGGACVQSCNSGFHVCNGACVSDTDPAHCGATCTVCSPPANSSPTCSGGTCSFTCNATYHACSGACKLNSDPAFGCGAASCNACPGPSPAGNGSASCSGSTCTIVCNNGFHLCGTACVSNTLPQYGCGDAACTACPGPTSGSGSATCNGSSCALTCNSGYHLCGTACIVNSDPAYGCGVANCAACPGPTSGSGSPTCSGSSCALSCNNGYHLCGSACSPNNDPSTGCGAVNCIACPGPTSGSGGAACNSGTCTLMCNTGNKLCGTDCVPSSGCCGNNDCTASPDPNKCYSGSCNGAHQCAYGLVLAGPCQSADKCMTGQMCSNAGDCTGGTAKTCPAPTKQCQVSACDPSSGNCQTTNASAGTACSTGDPCSQNEQCDANGNCGGDHQPDGTTCSKGSCQDGTCKAGVCACAPDMTVPPEDLSTPPVPDDLATPPAQKGGGCSIAGVGSSAALAPLAGLWLLGLVARRRRQKQR